jgi:general secretion pathway protein G
MERRKQQGFTLIELMVVITILGLLASIAAVNVVGYLKDAKIQTAKSDMRAIKDAIEHYRMKKSRLPDSIADLCGPEGDENRKLEWTEPQKDPWNHDYYYEPKGKTYDLVSYGADGQEGGEGEDADITLADLSKRGGGEEK